MTISVTGPEHEILEVTDLISDGADTEYAHNAYNCTRRWADRCRPTLKDDEQFRNGLVRDLVY